MAKSSGLVSGFSEQSRIGLRKKVRYFYDLQRLRLQMSGRLSKASDAVLDKADAEVLEGYSAELEKLEEKALKDIERHLKEIPFYAQVLNDKVRYRGVGPTMAAVILSEFDIYKMDSVSKAWSYAGLAPTSARRCNRCHTVVISRDGKLFHPELKDLCNVVGPIGVPDTYESGQAMRPVKGERLSYNKFLRTKLIGVLAPVILKLGRYRCLHCQGLVTIDKTSQGRRDGIKMYVHSAEAPDCIHASEKLTGDDVEFSDRPHFVKFYDNYKHRKLSAGWGRSDAHRHQAALRYMIKMLLLQLWKDWRAFEKLPMRPSYQEEKLGHVHQDHRNSDSADSPDEDFIDFDGELKLALR